MPAWARVFGWTALALSPIAILQREPLALAGTIVAGALLFLYGFSKAHDPNYMRTFPYEFVGDLEIRPDENPDSSTRLLRGGLLGIAYFLAANLVDSELNSVLASLPLSAILAIWGYQITDKPPRWVIAAAATAAALGAFAMAGLAVFLSFYLSGEKVIDGLLVGGIGGGAFADVMLSLIRAMNRTPSSLT